MNEEREYLEDGITPKEPRHYVMECESGKFEAPKVTYPPFGTAYDQEVIRGQSIQ
jgi:hypothetical protein